MAEDLRKLTKGQRRRANERSRKAQRELLHAQLGEMPDYLHEFMRGREPTITDEILRQLRLQLSPEERAPPHLVNYDEFPTFKTSEVNKLAKAGGDRRAAEAQDDRVNLKLKYPHLWGKRGKAKVIASLETETGDILSERTVQRYFQQERQKRQT